MRIASDFVMVVEMSERGLRFVSPDTYSLEEWIVADIALYCGRDRTVEGVIGRRQGDETVLMNMTGISFADVLLEQQALIRDFPLFGQGQPVGIL